MKPGHARALRQQDTEQTKMTNQCPKCSSARSLAVEHDPYGDYLTCIHCGFHRYLDAPRTVPAPEAKRSRWR